METMMLMTLACFFYLANARAREYELHRGTCEMQSAAAEANILLSAMRSYKARNMNQRKAW